MSFQEFAVEATEAVEQSIGLLKGHRVKAKAHIAKQQEMEAERQRLDADRNELERQKAELEAAKPKPAPTKADLRTDPVFFDEFDDDDQAHAFHALDDTTPRDFEADALVHVLNDAFDPNAPSDLDEELGFEKHPASEFAKASVHSAGLNTLIAAASAVVSEYDVAETIWGMVDVIEALRAALAAIEAK
jgi:hypothetical protein